jgi:phosphoesterase RecJ-like protein
MLTVPESRVADCARLGALLNTLPAGATIALSTHMNSDGDGCGSESALAVLLAQRGFRVRTVNPTPWPSTYDFLRHDDFEEATARGTAALRDIDAFVVLDTNDIRRLGVLGDAVRGLQVPLAVIDHHVPGDEPLPGVTFADVSACATGELVFDLAHTLGATITPAMATALYTAIMTDTGGFRHSNTSPRAHQIAAALLPFGVQPETVYRHIYAQVTPERLQLLREALATLQFDAVTGLSWMAVTHEMLHRAGASPDDLEGLVDHPRSIKGTRMAVLFRDLGHGKVKVSFRSAGPVDVQQLARRFGGGGHVKAAGALLDGTLAELEPVIVSAAKEHLARS